MNSSHCIVLTLAWLISFVSVPFASADAPRALVAEAAFDFGRVIRGSQVEHSFRIKNEGPGSLRLAGLRLTPPLVTRRMPMQVPPGEEASIVLSLDTSGLKGPFEGQALVTLNDPSLPEARFAFRGVVMPPIELVPLPAFFVSAQRGQPREKSIEIINHAPEPLDVLKVDHPEVRFTTKLETLEEGRRYRLTLSIRPDGPGGKHAATITVRTSNNDVPILRIPANTYLKERVYTFPDLVDIGSLPLSFLLKDPQEAGKLAQTLMVYQLGGSDFVAEFSSDLPMIRIAAERGPRGDRYQAAIELLPDKIKAGRLTGRISIRTNDPEFPNLSVPVTGTILDR